MQNETKIKILDLLSDGQWWTAPEVAVQLGLSLTNSSERLRQYRNGGLVCRHKVSTQHNSPRLYEYQITPTGSDRLKYLTCDKVIAGAQVGTRLGLKGKESRMLTRYIEKKLGR